MPDAEVVRAMEECLYPAAFEAWLRARVWAVVGRAGRAGDCPVAEWLKDQVFVRDGGRVVRVSAYDRLVIMQREGRGHDPRATEVLLSLETPRWLYRFVLELDARSVSPWYGLVAVRDRPVSGLECLLVVDTLRRKGWWPA